MIFLKITSKEMMKILDGSCSQIKLNAPSNYANIFESWKANNEMNTLILFCNTGLKRTEMQLKVSVHSLQIKRNADGKPQKLKLIFDIITLSDFASLVPEMRSHFRVWLQKFIEFNMSSLNLNYDT